MELREKVVIVTGASSGIGLASAHAFATAGARLVLAARSQQQLAELAGELGGEQRALALPLDLSQPDAATTLAQAALQHFGAIDVLVNNAGVGQYGPLVDAEWQALEQVLALNLLAPIHLIRAVVPQMRRQGGGVIINVGSVVGRRALPLMAAYSTTKFALAGLSQSLRLELASQNIQLALLLPGATSTAFNRALLGAPPAGGRRGGPLSVSAERVAARIVALARKPRSVAYVALHDRLWVAFCLLAPRLVDTILRKKYGL